MSSPCSAASTAAPVETRTHRTVLADTADATCTLSTAAENTLENLEVCTVLLTLATRLFHAPATAEDLAFFRQVDLDDPEDIACADPALREGLTQMKAFAESNEDTEALRRHASDDFNKMFVGPGHKPCPPWSSVYMDGKSLVNGPTAQRVKATFRAHGFAAPVGNHEPWDHIAYELQYIVDLQKRALCLVQEGALEDASSSLTDAADFIQEYIQPWIGSFFNDIKESARVDFYRGLADTTRAVLALNFRTIKQTLSELQEGGLCTYAAN